MVLCVAASEQALSVQMLVLETRGYRGVRAASAGEALSILKRAPPDTIDLVLLHLPIPGENELLAAARRFQPEIKTVVLSDKPSYFGNSSADVFIPKGTATQIDLYERIRVLLARKRGPKLRPADTPRKGVVAAIAAQKEEVA